MKRRHLLAVLAALIAVVALAVPSLAVAATPKVGWFSGQDDTGGSIRFRVSGAPNGTLRLDVTNYHPVDQDEFKPQSESDFERAGIRSDGRFGACALEPLNEVFFREYCIYGQFDAPDHASGTVRISISANGARWPKPLATFRWDAEKVPAVVTQTLASQVAVADEGALEWSGPLKLEPMFPYHVPPEQREGNVQLRIRNDSDGSPELALFKATIPYHCDNYEIGRLHYSYDPDAPGTKVTFRHIQVDGHLALAFTLDEKWGSGENVGDGELTARGTLVLEGGGGGKDPDGQGRLSFHRVTSPEKRQVCRSYGGGGAPMQWVADRKAR